MVSPSSASTLISTIRSLLIVPTNTWFPVVFITSRLSPVSELSSKLVVPEDTIVPSAGGVDPGGTRTMSPTSSKSADIFFTSAMEGRAVSSDLFTSWVDEDVNSEVGPRVNNKASEHRNLPKRVIALAA